VHIYAIDHEWAVPLAERRRLIGGKAAHLGVMRQELGLPVPPAFTVGTATCRLYLADGTWPEGLDEELADHMATLGAEVGRTFGSATDPLLVSVRSGAPVSMPGMMDTVLNLGLTEATVPALAAAAGDAAFAEDCYRRLAAVYRSVVGADLPQDPWEQLRGAIRAVFESWRSDRARTYRAIEGIPDDLGTGVTVQAMVFGNRGPDSATGVLFTRNPATGDPELFGDVLFGAQGEDVVAGTHETWPIAALATRLPAVHADLARHARALEHHFADMCDIEFTIEEGRLWLLQVRSGRRTPQAALRIARAMAEDPGFPLTRDQAVERVAAILEDPPRSLGTVPAGAVRLGEGLGASPGVAVGRTATDPDDAADRGAAGEAVILVRRETSPHDVHGMARAAGILTATGGLASHAAVVARGWGIPAVVGATCVRLDPDGVTIGDRRVGPDDRLALDGATGRIYLAPPAEPSGPADPAGADDIGADAAQLLEWAGQRRDTTSSTDPADPADPADSGGVTASPGAGPALDAGQVLRTLAVKGYGTPEALAAALCADPVDVTPLVAELVTAGDATDAGGMALPTEAGRTSGAALLAADGVTAGVERAQALLDAFVPLDQAVKDLVQAWQLKPGDGEPIPNDHADAAYDRAVLARLAPLHERAGGALRDAAGAFPRLAWYLARLGAAAAQVAAGQGQFVASPRVDSYHGVWFELHEELIHLAGTTRAAEVEAGRA
jgi:pyruvate,orthophosphate dikinase